MDNPHMMVPASDERVAQLALIEAMRVQNDQSSRMAAAVEKIGDQVTHMAQDLAVLKAQDVKNEMALIRQAITAAMQASEAKIDAQEAQWRAADLATKERIDRLLADSQGDRKNLWVAIEHIKGKLIPIVAAATMIGAAVLAWTMEKVLK